MYKKILIPTDGSKSAGNAVKQGVELAKMINAEVYGVYVVDVSAFTGIPTESIWEGFRGLLEEEGNKALKLVEKVASSADVKVTAVIKEGVPSEEIIKFAKNKGIDLIVTGTASRRGLDRFLLGSVAEKIVRTAPCPVMVVRN